MRRFNLNSKMLSIILCVILISVFTLTIAYAVLSTVLNINGNAEIVASNWNIYLNNPRVTSGSVNNNVPTISGNTLSFSAELTTPGDYYEFTVDIVNGGSIDAMIDSIVKTPELSDDQKKYLNYVVTYQNGESIESKQTLSQGSTMPIKVRIEFRKDISISDLPSTDSMLNLKLTLVYAQSDGTGTIVENNGSSSVASISGSLDAIGTVVKIGSEQFYVYGHEGNKVKLLSMYNLYVGNVVNDVTQLPTALSSPTGMQDTYARGFIETGTPYIGTINYASDYHFGSMYSEYVGSVAEEYVNNYKYEIEKMGIDVRTARLITLDELTASPYSCSKTNWSCLASSYSWIYSTSYWTMTPYDNVYVYFVYSDGNFLYNAYSNDYEVGIRPVLIISRDQLLGNEPSMITFSVDGVSYQAEEGMTWEEWIDTDYNTGNLSISNYCLYASNGNFLCNQYSTTTIVNNMNYQSVEMCE